jgi:hypothetical protein
MPLAAILHVLLGVTCAVHVVRTGRPYYWIFIILFFPVIGVLIYVVAELLPELLGTHAVRQAAGNARKILDPERAYREASRNLQISPTAYNMCALAEACVERQSYDEAITLYRNALVGINADAPDMMEGLARARFLKGEMAEALAVLDELRARNPDYRSADAHMIYARSLAALGRDAEALDEYEALTRYFSGEEARCRHALMLRKVGRLAEARGLFEQIVRVEKLAPARYIKAQREWIDVARANLEPVTDGDSQAKRPR